MTHRSLLALLAFCTIFLSACGGATSNPPPSITPASGSLPTLASQGTTSWASQVEMARRRVALRSILRTGDYYQARNDALRAIEYYETAHAEIKDEPNITYRLANAYYGVREFKKASDLYLQVALTDLDEPSKKRILSSLILDSERTDTKNIIAKLSIRPETKEYYFLLIDCANSPDKCVAAIEASVSKDVHIVDLQASIKNARETSGDEVFIQALLMGKLYEQGAFLAVKKLWSLILEKRPDYRVVLKISGYAAYELASYKESGYLLDRYYQMNPKDMEVANMLGIVNFLKEDYTTSNLYFNAAILGGYTPKLELERRLIYNYVLLGDTAGALKVFRHLLIDPGVQAEDFQIALYMTDQASEVAKFKLWSIKALETFPNDPTLQIFASKAQAYEGDEVGSLTSLTSALALDPTNPLGLIERSRKYIATGDTPSAKESLEKLLATDRSTYYREQAQKILDELSKWVSLPAENTPVTP